MSTQLDNVLVTLKTGVSSADTTFVCDDAINPYVRPSLPGYEYQTLVIVDNQNNPTVSEVIRYRKRRLASNGDVILTEITRGVDGTKAQDWESGAVIAGDFSLIPLDDINPPANPAVSDAQLKFMPRESGFLRASDTEISFDDGTRTFTLSLAEDIDEAIYFSNTIQYTLRSAKTVVIPDTEGLHFIYLDGSQLKSTSVYTDSLYTTRTFVASLYWDSTSGTAVMVLDQRHGTLMDSSTHLWAQSALGAMHRSGLGLTFLALAGVGNLDQSCQLTVTDGEFADEDLIHVIQNNTKGQQLDPIAQLPIYYREGVNGDLKKLAATDFPIHNINPGERAAWNEWTGATWQLTEADDQSYFPVHIAVTGAIEEPVIAIMAQSVWLDYDTGSEKIYSDAINLDYSNILAVYPDLKIIGSVLCQTADSFVNARKTVFRRLNVEITYLDWRRERLIANSAFSVRLEEVRVIAVAAENLTRGSIVSIQDNGGELTAYLADSTNPARDPMAICAEIIPAGTLFIAYFSSYRTHVSYGPLSPGIQFLDPLNPGQVTHVRPTTGRVWACGFAGNSPTQLTFQVQLVDVLP